MGQNEIGPQSDGTYQDKMGQIGMAQILEVRTYAKWRKPISPKLGWYVPYDEINITDRLGQILQWKNIIIKDKPGYARSYPSEFFCRSSISSHKV